MTRRFEDIDDAMSYAISLAERGRGSVEPNPMVGALVLDDNGLLIGEGFHERFGEAHAEVNAIAAAAGNTAGHTLIVTLEPCSHHGKTPPCAEAVIAGGFKRAFIGCEDPAPHVAGKGIEKLRAAGLEVTCGVQQAAAEALIAPFRKLMLHGIPWVHAKWAMTLDGRIATRTGHSQWITGESARTEVHRQRHLMDAILTGSGTVKADNPKLTARPTDSDKLACRSDKQPLRVVIDQDGMCLQPDSQLVQTIDEGDVLLSIRSDREEAHLDALRRLGVEVVCSGSGSSKGSQVTELLSELGRRQLTHVWLEAGPGLLGSFFDEGLVDEVHAFVAPKLIGGNEALSPVGGFGRENVPALPDLMNPSVTHFDGDLLIEGRLA